MRLLCLPLLIALPAAGLAQNIANAQSWYRTLGTIAAPCDDPVLDLPAYRGVNYDRDSRRLLRALMRVDPVRCPGVREAALAQLRSQLGDPDRHDVDLDLLERAWSAAERGIGMAPDPVLADRYGRMLWLFADRTPALPRWPEAERQAWLLQPGTIALLAARNADRALRTHRSLTLHTGLLLRRDLAVYDPALAATLLEDGTIMTNLESRLRISRLLTDGAHLPPDHVRAARPFLAIAALQSETAAAYQQELLRIGRLAASAARTPVQRAQSLRILFAASLDGRFGAAA